MKKFILVLLLVLLSSSLYAKGAWFTVGQTTQKDRFNRVSLVPDFKGIKVSNLSCTIQKNGVILVYVNEEDNIIALLKSKTGVTFIAYDPRELTNEANKLGAIKLINEAAKKLGAKEGWTYELFFATTK